MRYELLGYEVYKYLQATCCATFLGIEEEIEANMQGIGGELQEKTTNNIISSWYIYSTGAYLFHLRRKAKLDQESSRRACAQVLTKNASLGRNRQPWIIDLAILQHVWFVWILCLRCSFISIDLKVTYASTLAERRERLAWFVMRIPSPTLRRSCIVACLNETRLNIHMYYYLEIQITPCFILFSYFVSLQLLMYFMS